MTVRRGKKVRKFRGHRTYGTGSHKKARGAGNRGGRGKAGLHKYKWSLTVQSEEKFFGKHGFKRPQGTVKDIPTVNLKMLDAQAERLLKEKLAIKEDDKIKINVLKLGFEKVLGGGKISQPLVVEAKLFSKSAIKKLEKAGGKAIKIG
ncbi:MAG: uL15 family ribosomal protein [Candidatus Aenigmarchaeota archaeon]|nr:uL15 family ribosomal protein [Candidatus Aenigmarchaeota archaeon]